MVRRLFVPLLIAIISLVIAVPVLAAYYVDIDVTESNGTGYDMLPVVVTMDIDYLAEHGFISENGLDVRVKNSQGSNVPFMLAEDRVVFASGITGDMVSRFQLTTDNDLIDSFPVIVGDGGYVTIDDTPLLEFGDDFSVEFEGWLYKPTSYIYPDTEATATSTSSDFTHTVTLPSGVSEGGLLLLFFSSRTGGAGDHTLTWPPTGWTSLAVYPAGASTGHIGIAYRIADGTEGATVTVTTGGVGALSAHNVYRIVGYDGVPEIACTTSSTTNANPDPPALTPSWGSHKTLWMAGYGSAGTNDQSTPTYPTNYSNGLFIDLYSGSYDAGCASASRLLEAASADPGTFTMTATAPWYAWTVGVKGQEAGIYYKTGAFNLYADMDANTIYAKIDGVAPITLTASGVSLAEHIVTVWADGTDFGLDIDGSTEDSQALGAVSVPPNANNWILSAPYLSYCQHTTSDILRLTYAPDSIIVGTTLPNEENPGTYYGTITWGSNPAGISVSTSGLSTEEAYYIEDIDSGSRDIISPEPAQLISGVDLEKLESNPFHPLVEAIVSGSGGKLTESLVWIGGAWFLFIAALIGGFIGLKQNLVFTSAIGLGLSILFYVMGIFDYWVIIIFAFGAAAAVIHERMPTW